MLDHRLASTCRVACYWPVKTPSAFWSWRKSIPDVTKTPPFVTSLSAIRLCGLIELVLHFLLDSYSHIFRTTYVIDLNKPASICLIILLLMVLTLPLRWDWLIIPPIKLPAEHLKHQLFLINEVFHFHNSNQINYFCLWTAFELNRRGHGDT